MGGGQERRREARLDQDAGAQAAGVDAERLADVLEVEDVVPAVAAEPRERLALQVPRTAVGRVRILEERPDAVLEHRQEQAALAAGRLGAPVDGLVADGDVAVEAGRIARPVSERRQRRPPASRVETLPQRGRRLRDHARRKAQDRTHTACSRGGHNARYLSPGKPQTIVQSADFGTKSR